MTLKASVMSDIDTYPVTVDSDSIADHIQQIPPTPYKVMFVSITQGRYFISVNAFFRKYLCF